MDLDRLSAREREVLELALAGLSARDIAEELTLTEATVRSHLSRIYAKTGATGHVDLLARWNHRPEESTDRPQPSASEGPSPAPPQPDPASQPHVRCAPFWRRRGWVAAAALLALVAVVGAGWILIRPDLPPTTDLSTVSRLVSDGHVSSLDLRDDTLFVTESDGRHCRVERFTGSVTALAAAAPSQIHVSISGGSRPRSLVDELVSLMAVFQAVGLLIVVVVAARWVRGCMRPRSPTRLGA